MDVRHREAGADDTREHRHVDGLLERLIGGDALENGVRRVNGDLGLHAARAIARDAPLELVHALQPSIHSPTLASAERSRGLSNSFYSERTIRERMPD